ncbi:MAG: flagellar type III secretion system pore protein FliP [Candidatus Schekmanbacteria bacterium]|nr:flagellar type III secretion system pore protein FliP [Candidatus Schekmanbacteria bacterium]
MKALVVAVCMLAFGALALAPPRAAAQAPAPAAAAAPSMPKITVDFGTGAEGDRVALGLRILLVFTVLTVLPSIILMMTSFTRLIIVFHFLRQALGTQQMPPNQILLSLAIFLTFFIMAPVGQKVFDDAYVPYREGKMTLAEAAKAAEQPVRTFLLKQTREKDLALFVNLARLERPESPADVPLHVIIPAFMTSEVTTGFKIGFLLYLPFLVVDMVVASILLSMGMMMLPPIMISLPFKILLFVMVDGWFLLIGSLVRSFGT